MAQAVIRLSLTALLIAVLLTVSEARSRPVNPDLQYLKKQFPKLRESVLSFWIKNGLDKQKGAFHGTLDTYGKVIDPTDKGIFQTGRHLWAMSHYYEKFKKDAKVKALADNIFNFVAEHFYDKAEKRLYFKVNRDGESIGDNRGFQTQANWFGLLGIGTYAKVFKSKKAAQLATDIYMKWREVAWDTVNGGFNEEKDLPQWNPPGVSKSISVQTHGAEIMAILYDATKSEVVAKDLVRLTELIATKAILPGKGRVGPTFKSNWEVVESNPPKLDFSAEMQTWMLLDIIEQFPKLFTDAQRKTIADKVQIALKHAVSRSYDESTGSFCMSGHPDQSCVKTQTDRVWYAQTEGIIGLYKLYKYAKDPKDKAAWLSKLVKAVKWTSAHQFDLKNGEMFYTIDVATGKETENKGIKGSEWKASYHSGRMVMFMEQWL